LVVSPYVVAELDHLIVRRVGVTTEIAVLRELCGGAWTLADFGAADLNRAADVVDRYRDQTVGVADASLVVLAARENTRTIATLDHRHFTVLRPLSGGRFRLVP
jgi:predicted nucleic acid-binding protein